ncbi:protein FAM166B isoform X2 [Cervus elaphus]|uniref:protein FAM166B isoform X2 n=1 Tax=Cervus canadensis TaxID=1574408 RepID=UPI001C9E22DB|nr:protein FAM166B isoform X2 [Cervus canadensis]XP_043746792.1 protein FAM166B isoform X2 [Cervus elaphus]
MLGASGVSASLSGAGEAGLSGGEQVKPVLQVHWTLPATSVQHGPDLWTDDWAATSRLPWPSLAPCPPHTSASHSASKIPRASQEEPACHARTRKAQLQHGPWVHRFGRSGGQGSQELPEEAKGEKDVEKDHEPKPEAEPEAEKEPELGQEAEQVRWRRLRQSPAVGAGSPCLCVAMRRLAAGTEPDHQPHCPASLCYKPGAESVSRFSSLMSPHKASPYSMDDSDPRKFFMSGFTGYVPRARFLFGSSFPVLSNQALLEFGEMKSPGRSRKDPKHLPALSRTYPQHLGLLPKYGGYVPGYKFQFGRTYGHLTQDALALSTLQKQLLV